MAGQKTWMQAYFIYKWLSSNPLSYIVESSKDFQSITFEPQSKISSSSGEYHLAKGLLKVILTKPRLKAVKASSIPLFSIKSAYNVTNSSRFALVTGILSPFSFKLKLTTDSKLSVFAWMCLQTLHQFLQTRVTKSNFDVIAIKQEEQFIEKKSNLTFIEIDVMCEVPFYFVNIIIINKIIWLGTTMTLT